MNKKGISPLIATVLLITFSVALGAVVMTWGQEYVSEKAEFTTGVSETGAGCEIVSFGIIQVRGRTQACFERDEIRLFIENYGTDDIEGIEARVVGTEGVKQQEILAEPLNGLTALKTTMSYGDIGLPLQLKLIPKIKSGKTTIFCPKAAVTVDELSSC